MSVTLMEQQEQRLHELERGLAYEFAVSVLDADLESDSDDWSDEESDTRTDELVPECIEYLEIRGLIERKIGAPHLFRVRDESEAL